MVASALVGHPMLWSISDPKSGALLELGPRTPLARRIPNRHLTDEQQTFEGEQSLFIQCAWELKFPDDSPSPDSALAGPQTLELLDVLKGHSVTAATIDESSLELLLTFDNDVMLRVNPTAGPSRLVGGYTIRLHEFYWSVSDDGEIREEGS